VPFSFEVSQDAVNFVQEISKLLVDGLDQLTATAFTTGSGVDQPTGIITALAAGSSAVAAATANTLV
jgi:HK97 family phage major capsid protein